MAWGFLFATLLWTVVQPWWSFPAHRVGRTVSLQGHLGSWHLPVWALVLWVVVLGSIAPFALIVGALRHIRATRVGITAMLEPVVATVVAWAWLSEALTAAQPAGAGVVLGGILLAHDYFAHGDFAARMTAFHVRGLRMGENLAWGSGPYARATMVVREWLGSPEHRANLLDRRFVRIGVGVVRGSFQGVENAAVV